jgi:integrase
VPLLGAETVCAAVHLMSQLYDMARKETPPIVMVNPFAGLDLPVIRPHEIDFLEHDEADALYAAVEGFGASWRTLIELGTEVGLRPGELYGLHGHRVDWLRGKDPGHRRHDHKGLRQWPKSKKSHRIVPVPPHILEGMSALMAGRPRNALVFTAPGGGPVDDGNFRGPIWYPAMGAAGIRRFPPRIMRHTAASWLVIDGVPLYDVQALICHENYPNN